MKLLEKSETLEVVKSTLKNALTETFGAFAKEIHEVMDELGEEKEEYLIRIHPWSVERLDGQPVPDKLLRAIQAKLQSDQ